MTAENEGVVSFRLEAVEKGLAGLREDVIAVRNHVDSRLDRVQGSIASLQFVSREVYEVNHRGLREYGEQTRETANLAKSIAMWALGIMVSTAIAAVIALLRVTA